MRSDTLRRIAGQLRAQWAGFLTIFLFLGMGGAYALPGVNTVFSDDIVDGEVTSADVANGSLTGGDARSLSTSDIASETLGTRQVSESSLGIVPEAGQAGSGRAGSGASCSESARYVDCARLPVDLARPGRLLIIASVTTSTSLYVSYVRGSCRLEVNGLPIEESLTIFRYDDEGERTPFGAAPEGAGQHATLTAVTEVYPTGGQVVGVECSLIASGASVDGVEGTVHAGADISTVALSDK